LQNVVLRVLEDLNVPIAFGLRSGHVTRENITLPFGVESELTVQGTAAELAILEPSVS
jgi:muramoyltetrapeptide carboxypeptidase